MNKNIFFGIGLAPYRIDLYNYLSTNFNCKIYFLNKKMQSQNYNMQLLLDKCCYEPLYLKSKAVGKRKIVLNIRQIIKENHPSYVFVPEFSILTIQVLLIKVLFNYKFKVISICDDSYDMIMGNDFSKQHRFARNVLSHFLDNLIVVDNRVCKWFQKKHKKGIWLPIISDENRVRKEYERLLPLSNQINNKMNLVGQKVILFVGRLVSLKNISTLIEAYAPLKEKAKLIIIGEGVCRNELENQNNKLQTNVVFMGRKEGDELLAWYNIADIFVLPSTQEAFGAVTNEALLAGCIAIVSEKAGSSSIIKSGDNGLIFNPYSAHSLTISLEKCINRISTKENIVLKQNLMRHNFKDCMKSIQNQLMNS